MPPRRRPLARVVLCAWPLAWPLAGCQFDGLGLGSTTAVDLTSASSTGPGEPPDTSTTTISPTTGEPTTGEPGSTSTTTATTDDPCPDGCPPMAGWTVVVDRVGVALTLDTSGDIFVAGEQAQTNDKSLRDVWVARFAADDGETLWEQRHNGAEHRTDFARGLALSGDGATLVVVGGSQEGPNRRIDVWAGWLATADGAKTSFTDLGTTHWNGDDPQLDEFANGVALDVDGQLFVVGRRCLFPCELPEAWLGRFTAEGKPVWLESMLYAGQGSLRAVLEREGSLYAVGTDGYPDAPAPWRTLIRRYDSTGGGTWSALQEDDSVSFEALAVALAGDGGLWVVGRESDPAGPEGGFLRHYLPDRDDEPVHELRGEALDGELAAISLTADGAPVVAGAAGDGSERHLWLARFTVELAPVWRIDEPAAEVAEARALAHDGAGDLVVLGHTPTDQPEASPDSWLRKYSQAPR
jgi:hypothetical protein